MVPEATAQKVAILAATVLAGCSSMYGAHHADGSEQAHVVARYSVVSCADAASGAEAHGADSAEYWLINDTSGPALVEMQPSGQGLVITNTWPAADGAHFFAWDQASGWEYVVPADRTLPATRFAYVNPSTTQTGSVTKPTGAPGTKCVMQPVGASAPSPSPAPSAAASPGLPATSAPPPPTATPAPAPSPAPTPAPAPSAAPTPAPSPPAPSATPRPKQGTKSGAAGACFPQCRVGYVCIRGKCVSACNPPCPSGTKCSAKAECEPIPATTP